MKTTDERLAELERQMACVTRWANPGTEDYTCRHLHRDLTTPPPKERPKIEVVGNNEYWGIKCGDQWWQSMVHAWSSNRPYGLCEFNARAIAAALEAAGNYPEEYKEKAR